MKTSTKKKLSRVFIFTAVLLGIGFVASLFMDYNLYYKTGSSPFYLYVIERFCETVIPAILCILVAKILKKECKEEAEMRAKLREKERLAAEAAAIEAAQNRQQNNG